MKKQKVTDLFVYKLRYFIGYSVLVFLYIGAVVMSALYTPGGLTQAEIDTLSITNNLNLDANGLLIANLPFHVLQWVFIKFLGVSILTIKAPAIVLSIISSISIFFLLRRWFKPRIAILTLLIMTTTAQLLFIGQNATPSILYITYTALILLFATLIIQGEKMTAIWRLGLVNTVALSLFTPYFWYINLGLLFIGLMHPHTRFFLVSRKHRTKWLLSSLLLLIIMSMIAYGCYKVPHFMTSLLGASSLHFDILNNLRELYYIYIRFEPSVVSGQLTPIMDFGSIFLVIFGLLKSLKDWHTARSFMLWSWIILSVALLLMRPELTVIIVVPLIILLAVGIETLLDEWYKLFPHNPYARGVGLTLTSVLIMVLVICGASRYADGYRHFPQLAHYFTKDLTILKADLVKKPDQNVFLLVDETEASIYEILAKYQLKSVTVIHQLPQTIDRPLYVSRLARQRTKLPVNNVKISHILVGDTSKQADRFYVYTLAAK